MRRGHKPAQTDDGTLKTRLILSLSKDAPAPVRFPLVILSLACVGLLLCTSPALAHGTEGAIILLLPTGYYLIGGGVAVAASFSLLAFMPAGVLERWSQAELRLCTFRPRSTAVTSLLGFLVMLALLYAGVFGSRDPRENPLPLFVWTIGWVGFTLLQAVVGTLMPLFNPWSGPLALIRLVSRLPVGKAALMRLPERLGYLPAIVIFLGFAWFELVDLAPNDPFRLAVAVGGYWLFALAGMILFGEAAWMGRAEPFSIFYGLVGGMAPLLRRRVGEGRRLRIVLTWPGRALMEREPMPPSGVLFVLLTLSSVSFDGFSRTFVWLGRIGVNPLEFPGRSAVVLENTLGLLAAFILLAGLFLFALLLGRAFFGVDQRLWPAAGRLVYSILPISIAFHAAHYLTSLLVDGQYAYAALNDPLERDWDLLGLGHVHVTTSFLNTFEDVTLIWNVQTLIICLGHIVGIVMAHIMAQRLFLASRSIIASQLGLAALMVAYTVFGLWLLSTPAVG